MEGRVLVVDDEPQILRALQTNLRGAGYEVTTAATAEEALSAAAVGHPDAVILDLVLPDGRGTDVARELRRWSSAPILVLSAVGDEQEKVAALDAGADDYVTKPFGRQELIARVEALLRRAGDSEVGDEVHADGLVEIDFKQRRVSIAGKEVDLTPTEFRLLAALVRHPNQVLSHDQLLDMAWGDANNRSRQQVKLYIGYVRRKLVEAADRDPIETVRGFGYRYRPTPAN